MRSRLLFVITAILICHLFPAAPLVTGQERPSTPSTPGQQAEKISPGRNIQFSATEGSEVDVSAHSGEKQGDVYTLSGDVQLRFQGYTVGADTMTYDSNSGEVAAEGHVSLDGGPHDMHLTASHGTYSVHSQTGTFYDADGTVGARFAGKKAVLTSSSPLVFSGKVVEKTGPEEYVVHQGMVTSCQLPKPKWTLGASTIMLEPDRSSRLYNAVFRLKGVPVVYLPYAAPPLERINRQSGFLVPSAGNSNTRGLILGDAFYWAINRSMDATFAGEYFSRRGWSLRDDFRARFSDTSYINLTSFGVLDRGFGTPNVKQGGEDAKLSAVQDLPYGIRGVASLEYLSSLVFRQAFTENFTQAVDSEVKSSVFFTKNRDGLSLNLFGARYQNFQSTTPGDVITIFHVPGVELSSVDQPIGDTPLYWSLNSAAEGLYRSQPGFVTPDLTGRFDIQPDISLPIFYQGWTLRPEVTLRDTYYTESQQPPAGTGVGVGIGQDTNRRALETAVEVRPPALEKVFSRPVAGRKVKHTIEPRLIYRYTNGVDHFGSVIRFDFRDVLSDTNEVEYGLVHRLYFKHEQEQCPSQVQKNDQKNDKKGDQKSDKKNDQEKDGNKTQVAEDGAGGSVNCAPSGAHEFLTWELKQKYFFDPNFGGDVVNGRRNVLDTTVDFTGIAFLTDPRRFSPLVSRIRLRTSENSDMEWQLDYDSKKGRINASTFYTTFHLGDFFVGGSHAYLQVPGEVVTSPAGAPLPLCAPGIIHQAACVPGKFNQVRALVGFGSPTRQGLSVAANIGFDSFFNYLQYSAAQASYNWNCCGLSLEYRRFAFLGVRNDNQLRYAFSLANLATFGNLKRQLRLF